MASLRGAYSKEATAYTPVFLYPARSLGIRRTASFYLTSSFVLLNLTIIGHEKQSIVGMHALLNVYVN